MCRFLTRQFVTICAVQSQIIFFSFTVARPRRLVRFYRDYSFKHFSTFRLTFDCLIPRWNFVLWRIYWRVSIVLQCLLFSFQSAFVSSQFNRCSMPWSIWQYNLTNFTIELLFSDQWNIAFDVIMLFNCNWIRSPGDWNLAKHMHGLWQNLSVEHCWRKQRNQILSLHTNALLLPLYFFKAALRTKFIGMLRCSLIWMLEEHTYIHHLWSLIRIASTETVK